MYKKKKNNKSKKNRRTSKIVSCIHPQKNLDPRLLVIEIYKKKIQKKKGDLAVLRNRVRSLAMDAKKDEKFERG